MMDIYEYLKADHAKVSDLFKLFDKTKVPEVKIEIVDMIIQELSLHAHTEQDTFYKALEQYPESKDAALHGVKEHAEIDAMIDKILPIDEPTKEWENDVLELKKLVEHHVKEEEGKIFDKAKKVLSKEQTYIIKEQMHYLKTTILQEI
jgi:hypothetical protein